MKLQINLDNHQWPKYEKMSQQLRSEINKNYNSYICAGCGNPLHVIAFGKGYLQRPHLKIKSGYEHIEQCGRSYYESLNQYIGEDNIQFFDIDLLFERLFELGDSPLAKELLKELISGKSSTQYDKKPVLSINKKAKVKELKDGTTINKNEIFWYRGQVELVLSGVYKNRHGKYRESLTMHVHNVRISIFEEYFDYIPQDYLDTCRQKRDSHQRCFADMNLLLFNRINPNVGKKADTVTLSTWHPNDFRAQILKVY